MNLTRDEYRARYPQVSSIATPDPRPLRHDPDHPGRSGRSAPSACRGPRTRAWTTRRWPTSRTLVDAGAQALGRARLEDAERRTRSLLRAIVDQIPLGILILEPDGTRPLYMNRKFSEIFADT